MKKTTIVLLLVVCAICLQSQTTVNGGRTTLGVIDNSGATHTLAVKVVANVPALPATCTAGELAVVTGATLGQQIYQCSAGNVWTQQLNSGTATGGGITMYSGTAVTVTANTYYIPVGGGGTPSTTETNVDIDSPAAATITNMYVQLSVALGVGNTGVFTFRKNATSQSVTCTVSGGSATSCSDTTHSFNVSQGDLLTIQLVTTGTIVVTPNILIACQFGNITATGTVNTGTAPRLAYFAANGSAVSDIGTTGSANQPLWSNGASAPGFAPYTIPATIAAHQTVVATGTTAVAAKTIPDCTDTGGNHLNFAQSGDTFSCGTSGGSSAFPLTFVQEGALTQTANATSVTATFSKTTAASGNTIFMIVAYDGSNTVTFPAGWTVDLNVTQASFARFALLHKATAAESSANFTSTASTTLSVYYFEVTGSHTLDQSTTAGVANTQNLTFSAITPTANSVVFGMACLVMNGTLAPSPNIDPSWRLLYVGDGVNGQRVLAGFVQTKAATNVSTTPPQLGLSGTVLFGGGGIAFATFSIL